MFHSRDENLSVGGKYTRCLENKYSIDIVQRHDERILRASLKEWREEERGGDKKEFLPSSETFISI